MLSELVNTLVEMGRESSAKTFSVAAEPKHVYYLRDATGVLTRVEALRESHDSKVRDVPSLVELLTTYARIGSQADDGSPADSYYGEFWYSRDRVELIYGVEMRNRARMHLSFSPQFSSLIALAKQPQSFDQKMFLRLLRITLAGCVPPSLVDCVRLVKFRQNSQGESEIRHGKASIGKSLEAEIHGQGDIPEEVVIRVPVFTEILQHRLFSVRCAIELDAAAERFSLTPLPGCTEEAVQAAEAETGALIRDAVSKEGADEQVPVLYGNSQ